MYCAKNSLKGVQGLVWRSASMRCPRFWNLSKSSVSGRVWHLQAQICSLTKAAATRRTRRSASRPCEQPDETVGNCHADGQQWQSAAAASAVQVPLLTPHELDAFTEAIPLGCAGGTEGRSDYYCARHFTEVPGAYKSHRCEPPFPTLTSRLVTIAFSMSKISSRTVGVSAAS